MRDMCWVLVGAAMAAGCSEKDASRAGPVRDGFRSTLVAEGGPSEPAARTAVLERTAGVLQRRLELAKRAGTVAVREGKLVLDLPTREAQAFVIRPAHLELAVVDSAAPVMHELAKHIPQDPEALGLGIQVDVDTWSTESGPTVSMPYLVARDTTLVVAIDTARELGCVREWPRGGGEQVDCHVSGATLMDRYLKHLAARDSRFEIPADRRVAFEQILPPDGFSPPYSRSYVLHREAKVTGASIASAKVQRDPYVDRKVVVINFDPRGQTSLGELTAANVGQKVATVLDGTVLNAAIVMSAIRGGRFFVPLYGRAPREVEVELEELAIAFTAGQLPVRLKEESVVELAGGVPKASQAAE